MATFLSMTVASKKVVPKLPDSEEPTDLISEVQLVSYIYYQV